MTATPIGTSCRVGGGGRGDQASRLRALIGAPGRSRRVASPGSMRVVAVASGKGGVGKTNLAVNLCIALTRLGCRATLLDADMGMANADLLCGLTPTRRLDHVLGSGVGGVDRSDAGWGGLDEISVMAPGGFRLVPGSVGIARMADLEESGRERMIGQIAALERDSDVVLIDTAAGVGRVVRSFVSVSDLALVVATPEPTSIADAYGLIKSVVLDRERTGRSGPGLALVVNQARDAEEAASVHARIAAVCGRFLGTSLPMLGWVVQDVRVATAVRHKRPVLLASPKAPASRDMAGLGRRLAELLELRRSDQVRASGGGRLARMLRRLAFVPVGKE